MNCIEKTEQKEAENDPFKKLQCVLGLVVVIWDDLQFEALIRQDDPCLDHETHAPHVGLDVDACKGG